MIIENIIDKVKLQGSMKLFVKYAMLENTKIVKKCIIIGLMGAIVVFLCNIVLQKLFFLIFGIITILYNIFLILRYKNTQNKVYNKALKEQLNKYGEQESMYRKHIFDGRTMTLEIYNGENKDLLTFNFDNYYKVWIEEIKNIIVIQFNQKPNGKIVIIYCEDINTFKQYCISNNINYEIVKTK